MLASLVSVAGPETTVSFIWACSIRSLCGAGGALTVVCGIATAIATCAQLGCFSDPINFE